MGVKWRLSNVVKQGVSINLCNNFKPNLLTSTINLLNLVEILTGISQIYINKNKCLVFVDMATGHKRTRRDS